MEFQRDENRRRDLCRFTVILVGKASHRRPCSKKTH